MADKEMTNWGKALKLDKSYKGICSREGQMFRAHAAKVGDAYFELRMPQFPLNDIAAWQSHYGANLTEEYILEAVAAQLAYKADNSFKDVILAGKSHVEAQAMADTYKPGVRVGGGGRVADPTTITKKMVARAETDEAYKLASIAALEATLAHLKEKK